MPSQAVGSSPVMKNWMRALISCTMSDSSCCASMKVIDVGVLHDFLIDLLHLVAQLGMLVGIGGVLQIGRHQLVAHGVEVGQLGLQCASASWASLAAIQAARRGSSTMASPRASRRSLSVLMCFYLPVHKNYIWNTAIPSCDEGRAQTVAVRGGPVSSRQAPHRGQRFLPA